MKPISAVLVAALLLRPVAAIAQDAFEAREHRVPHSTPSGIDRAFSLAAWPGYGMTLRDRTVLGKTQRGILAGERAAFAFDLSTSGTGVSPGSKICEGDPLNTLFGNRNKMGIYSSMLGWEMGYSYSAAVVPHWFEHTKYRKPVRIIAMVFGGFLIEEHVRSGACNLLLARKTNAPGAHSCSLF